MNKLLVFMLSLVMLSSAFATTVPRDTATKVRLTPRSTPAITVTTPEGELWFDSTNKKLKVFDGTSWCLAGTATSTAITDLGGGWTCDTSTPGTLNFKYNTVSKGTLNSSGVFASTTGTFTNTVNTASLRDAAGTGAAPLTLGAVVSASKGILFNGGAAPSAPTTGVMLHGGTLANQDIEVLGKSGSAFGICSPRLAVGPAGSPLPTKSGCVKTYTDFSGAVVAAFEVTDAGATADNQDNALKCVNSAWISANGGISDLDYLRVASGVYGPSLGPVSFPAGLALRGSAEPSAPTTGVVLWGDLVGAGANPTISMLGAAGKTPHFTAPGTVTAHDLWSNASITAVNEVRAAMFYGYAGGLNTAARFLLGLYTDTGYGIGVGTSAPAGNWIAVKKGTDPIVGIVDCNVIFTRSADEVLVTTDEDGPATVLPN